MSDKKPGTMDEFLKISQSKRMQEEKDKKKKEKDKDKGKPKETAGKKQEKDKDKGKAKEITGKKSVDKKPSEPSESGAQPSSKDIFALLEETETEAQTKIRNQILGVVQGLVQAYGEIPITRIAKRIPDETEERVVSVLEDLIICGALNARLSTDKIIPIEGMSKISIDKSALKGKSGSEAPTIAEEVAKPELQKAPKYAIPSPLAEVPSSKAQKHQKEAPANIVPLSTAAHRAPSIPTIPEPPSLSLSRGKQQLSQVDETEIPDFPNPEPVESNVPEFSNPDLVEFEVAEIPASEPMENVEAPEPVALEDEELAPTTPVVHAPRAVQKPVQIAPKPPVVPRMKPGLKPMKVPAPKLASKPIPAIQKPMIPKVPAVPSPPVKPSIKPAAGIKPAKPTKAPAVPAVPSPPVKPSIKPPAGMKPVKPAKVPAVPVVPSQNVKPSIKPAAGMKPVKPAKAPTAPTVPQVPRIAKPGSIKPAKPVSKEEQAAVFEQRVNEMLQDRPEELSLVYKLFENPKLALLGFDEDWIATAMGITPDHAVELIKYLRGLNIVKLSPSGLNFIINTNL